MPSQELPIVVNKPNIAQQDKPVKAPDLGADLTVMKIDSRTLTITSIDLRRQRSTDSLGGGLPKVTIDDVDSAPNMSHVNGSFRDPSPSPQETPRPGRVISASMMRSAFSASEPSAPTEQAWSSAVGHASTGKSGRVIERLQAEIDKLRRENQLIKVQFEEAEKANETLATRCQYLQDRNSNYEASHEANVRQLERKERQVQDLRDEVKREKEKTARADERAVVAANKEETWRDEADQAKAIAQQKETEYDMIAACRTSDSDRYQSGLDKIKVRFNTLLKQREEDDEKHKKLQIIAEQQRKTIQDLEQFTKKLSENFKAYRSEIDTAIEGLRQSAGSNDRAVSDKLKEMQEVTGSMRWVMNVEQIVNHKQIPLRPTSANDSSQLPDKPPDAHQVSPARKSQQSVEAKSKGKNRFSKSFKS